MCFLKNPEIIFFHFFHIFNLNVFCASVEVYRGEHNSCYSFGPIFLKL